MKTISEQKHFDGTLGYYGHVSKSCACDMHFTVFVPP